MFGSTTQTENCRNLGRNGPAHLAMLERSAVMAGTHVLDVSAGGLIVHSRTKRLFQLTVLREKSNRSST